MELDELQRAWTSLDAQLARQSVELRRLREAGSVSAARDRLRRVTLGQWVQLAIGLAIVVWAGGYWWGHLGTTHLVVYGLGLHAYGLALVIGSATQLAMLLGLDYRKPVLEVQRKLVALRKARVCSERALLVLGFVAWVPLVFVALNAIGLDMWRLRPMVVLSNLGVGLVLSGLVYWLTGRFRERFENDSSGRGLREAQAELDALDAPTGNAAVR